MSAGEEGVYERAPALAEYVRSRFATEPALLAHLREILEESDAYPTIQVPAETGRLLEVVAAVSGAKKVLEIGTLGGYSGLWLFRGMPEGGTLLTLEKEPAHAALARRFFRDAGVLDRVEIREGEARELLPAVGPEAGFDLVFIDADKEGYVSYLEHAARLLRTGGVLLADNALWRGRILDPDDQDAATRGIRDFDRRLADHPDFRATIVPVGDGVALGVKR